MDLDLVGRLERVLVEHGVRPAEDGTWKLRREEGLLTDLARAAEAWAEGAGEEDTEFRRLLVEEEVTVEVEEGAPWVALATADGKEVDGTRQAWAGDVGYAWDGAELGVGGVEVEGALVFVPFSVKARVLNALTRLAVERGGLGVGSW